MAAPNRVVTGARAKIGIYDPSSGQISFVGTFSSCSFGLTYDVQPAFILGRYTAASLNYTAVEVVQITCTGWRVMKHGFHVDGRLPRVQDLMAAQYLSMIVDDRQTEQDGSGDPRAFRIDMVLPASGSSGYSAKEMATQTMTYLGILAGDEDGMNAEHPSAMNLPAA